MAAMTSPIRRPDERPGSRPVSRCPTLDLDTECSRSSTRADLDLEPAAATTARVGGSGRSGFQCVLLEQATVALGRSGLHLDSACCLNHNRKVATITDLLVAPVVNSTGQFALTVDSKRRITNRETQQKFSLLFK